MNTVWIPVEMCYPPRKVWVIVKFKPSARHAEHPAAVGYWDGKRWGPATARRHDVVAWTAMPE